MKKTLTSEAIFMALLRDAGLPRPVTEYRFHVKRLWRMDYAWVEDKVALEVEGGIWAGGRHNRASGFLRDMEKYNTATMMGWRVVRCTPQTLTHRETIEMIAVLLGAHYD